MADNSSTESTKLVRVTYPADPKRAKVPTITIPGVGSFTRGAGEYSEPIEVSIAETLRDRRGFDIVTDDQYAAAVAEKTAKPATERPDTEDQPDKKPTKKK